ncbi:MAG: hypothetical protein R6W72_08995, partial [Desulfurivibrionaceae bacterium]
MLIILLLYQRVANAVPQGVLSNPPLRMAFSEWQIKSLMALQKVASSCVAANCLFLAACKVRFIPRNWR